MGPLYDIWRDSQVVRQRSATPSPPVQIRLAPLLNYLMAAIQVQYKSGDNYYWYPSSSSYVYSEGSNTTGVSKTVNESNITYAKGWFKARCGTGSTKSFYRTATK